jgi:hypothetical protein
MPGQAMKSNRFLRIIVVGSLLLFAIGALRQWLPKHQATDQVVTIVETESKESATAAFQPAFTPLRSRTWSEPATQPLPAAPAQALVQLPGQKLFVEWKGTWYPAEILASAAGSNFIRYTGYGSEWDEWVMDERMRHSDGDSVAAAEETAALPASPDVPSVATVRMTPEPGDPVVLWGNRWWRAEVLQTEDDHSLIRYVGYGAEWDEWVGTDRFKVYSVEDAVNSPLPETIAGLEPQLDHSPVVQGSPARGDLLVEWGKKWWPAEILQQEGNDYFIHYKNYGSHWDEWVTPERIGIYSGDE